MPLNGGEIDRIVPLPDLLARGLASKPDEVALVSLLSRYSWRQLDERAIHLAKQLLRLGLAPGDRVACLMPNRTALAIFYLATLRAGLVAVPLNYRLQAHGVEQQLKASGAALLFVHAERDSEVAKLGKALRCGLLSYDSPDGREPSFEGLMNAAAEEVALPTRDPDAPAFVFYTSGSTGPAKGVTHSERSMAAMLASNAQGFALSAEDIVLPASSMAHLGAFFLCFAALSVGARVVLARTFSPEETHALIRRERPSVLMMLQTALFGVLRNPGVTAADLSCLRLCRCGGDKVSTALQETFRAMTGQAIHEGLGITEAGQIAFNRAGGQIKLGSIGRPLPGVQIAVRDADDRELPAGRTGRMWVKAPSVMTGYWNDQEATAEVMRDGWFYSGDLVEADQDGFLWFRGRQKHLIVHDASNITPQEVEEALLEHPAVTTAGVVGVEDPLHGENVLAFVSLKQQETTPSAAELIDFARGLIGYKAPESIVVLDRLPLNPTGKLDRVALKAMAAEASA
ncbi:MAG: long-chain fatty acid--CoA ligase [Rhodospirillales bacterium]